MNMENVSAAAKTSEKRLEAVPWATTCIRCQEATEMERAPSVMVLAGSEREEMDS